MIKVGLLVSYDYAFLYKSIPLIYKSADTITLAVDKDYLTWSGNLITIEDSFFEWIKNFDTENKITIYRDQFYVPENTAAQNDTRGRNMLGQAMGKGGWHIQIDSDEYFVDFDGFAGYLKSMNHYLENPEKNPVEIHVQWITLFRKVENGFLYIKDAFDAMEVATNVPFYKYMRSTRHRRKIITKFILLHQSWAWEEDEIYTKITNWSHKDDSDNFAYFNFRKGINLDNYKTIKNFHEKDPTKWKSLEYVAEKDIYNLSINMSDASLRKMRYKKHLIHILREYFPKSVQQKIGTIFKKLTK